MRGSNFGENRSSQFIEPLEQRRLFAAFFDTKNVLNVIGTTGDDVIRISLSNLDSTKLYVRVNDIVKKFAASKLVSTGANTSKIVINGLAGNDRIEIDDVGLNFASNIHGGDGNDSIDGGAAADKIVGGPGDDTIDGNLGNDSLYGGKGNDSLLGGNGNDFLDGEAGNDTVHGNRGTDRCHGGNGEDFVDGDANNDYVDGGAGVDSVYGGDGIDRFSAIDSISEDKDLTPEDSRH